MNSYELLLFKLGEIKAKTEMVVKENAALKAEVASLRNAQQLKAKNAAFIEKHCPKNEVYHVNQESTLIEKLRQLSAV